ncbi:MAG TPA: retroviral-like aspartic protease family protein [Leptolyngbyaceae cyanobacterium M33_DOE_097]|uniref:Aspartyl protease n=1 Tax=Oscillatoriales cyanobacterium SpSt-418 TaxID=2282169 RepID=A0A7C3KG06_9CYAN|nr:retroviral-like aspartic protease family protein [Leptolyngbyaceae cyanobacterium M33_DOE_097]
MRRELMRLGSRVGGAVLMLTPLLAGVPPIEPALAQEGGCFMITASGQRVNLTKLCGEPGSAVRAGVHTARIKRREGGTPVIDVTFNGLRTFEMLLDTGASGTLITQAMANELRIPVVARGQFGMADGRVVVLPIGRVSSIAIDGAEARNVQVVIAPDTATGLLGQNFFGQYDIKIKRDVVEFYRR